MTAHDSALSAETLYELMNAAEKLGYEIVDISGFLDEVDGTAKQQAKTLGLLSKGAKVVRDAATAAQDSKTRLKTSYDRATTLADETVIALQASNDAARETAAWVHDVSERSSSVDDTLKAVKSNNQQVVSIARQVNTLAINAKIEAARAGDAGRGFSVVADAINDLSQQTSKAAVEISKNVDELSEWIVTLSRESMDIASKAETVLEHATRNDSNLDEMLGSMRDGQSKVAHIEGELERMRAAMEDFSPSIRSMEDSVASTSAGITRTHSRINSLVDVSEGILQNVAGIGAKSADAQFITFVQSAAAEISKIFTKAMLDGQIREADLFDGSYVPIAGSNPEQVTTRFTNFTDSVLPDIQEPALELSDRVVFCAAVDTSGYLPTHNLKFSQPPSDDPVWNAGNCRNRRIFDDRVGLKAGRSKAAFLQQTYRRDMGGGKFVMMKDISAPIFAGARHWGGLRLAVKF